MSREVASIIIGIAVQIIFGILEVVVTDMPAWLAISGFTIGGLLLLAGIIGLIRPKRKKEEQTMSDQKDNITQNIYGNQGIVIGKIGQLTLQGQPKPTITISDTTETALNDSTFQYVATLNVVTSFTIPKIIIVAEATSVKSMAIESDTTFSPYRSGEMDYAGIKYPGIEVQNVSGRYKLTIITNNKEGSIKLTIQK